MPDFGKPTGRPLRPNGPLGGLLGGELGVGQSGSVWTPNNPHGPDSHTDATLYRKYPDGKIYPIGKQHIPGK